MKRPRPAGQLNPSGTKTDAPGFGPNTSELYNLCVEIRNRCGLSVHDIMAAYYATANPEFWTVEIAWKKKEYRFFIEVTMCLIQVIEKGFEIQNDKETALEEKRKQFYEAFGLDLRQAREYRVQSRKDFPRLSRLLNKELPASLRQTETNKN